MIYKDIAVNNQRRKEVDKVLKSSIQLAHNSEAITNDILLFLTDAQGNKSNQGFESWLYVYKDNFFSRLYESVQFYSSSEFQNVFIEGFAEESSSTIYTDLKRRQSIMFDLMVYCQIWESRPFLKRLYRLACLIKGQKYPWKVKIKNSRSQFIRHRICPQIKDTDPKLYELVYNSFDDQLRNAFSHSQVGFVTNGIYFSNRNNPYQNEGLTFDNVEQKVLDSILLYMLLHENIKYYSSKIGRSQNAVFHVVSIPDRDNEGSYSEHAIKYDENEGIFRFYDP